MYKKGEILYDKIEDSHVVVAQTLSTAAGEIPFETEDGETTVADYNEDRGLEDCQDDPVVVAVYEDQLQVILFRQRNERDIRSGISREGRGILARRAIEKDKVEDYFFPRSRLERLD